MQKVVDTKIVVRSLIGGNSYGDPKAQMVTGPTLEAYLHDLHSEGWSLLNSHVLGQDNVSGVPTINTMFVLVRYEAYVGAGSAEQVTGEPVSG